jgi:hypothetical protein
VQVRISGIRGRHPIETGVAYWYRGHYLYGIYGNPLEPVSFATKEIHILGTTMDSAPPFDRHEPWLQEEGEIAALRKSMVHEWQKMMMDGVAEPSAEIFAGQLTMPRIVEVDDQGKQIF